MQWKCLGVETTSSRMRITREKINMEKFGIFYEAGCKIRTIFGDFGGWMQSSDKKTPFGRVWVRTGSSPKTQIL
jgi:hypothetical protein